MSNPKLNEIIAVATGKKGEVQKAVTETYHKIQKEGLFDGLSRTYRPREELGERLPSESKQPQLKVKDLVSNAAKAWKELFDIIFTLDHGNCIARSSVDVQINEEQSRTLLTDVPATTLLFLEKQLKDVHTFVSKLPTPDPSEVWKFSKEQEMLMTDPTQTARTKKEQKALVMYPATEQHPAQTQLVTEDKIVGDWTQILYTTRIPANEKFAMLERIDKLVDAVKVAREKANSTQVEKKKMGDLLLSYIFGGFLQKK